MNNNSFTIEERKPNLFKDIIDNRLITETIGYSEKGQSKSINAYDFKIESENLFKEKMKNNFLQIMKNTSFEYGYHAETDDFLNKQLKGNNLITKEWIQELFLENFSNEYIVTSILRTIAHIEYKDIYPHGMTIATAAISHKSIIVTENAIRAFENWESSDSLIILENVKCSDAWLDEYLKKVIENIKEENSAFIST